MVGLRMSVAVLSVLLAASAWSQTFPTKPVFLIVPYSAGGGQDVYARALAQRLGEAWGQPMHIENRVGANGIIGTEYVAKAPPDGHVLLFSDTGSMVLTPILYKGKVAYDPDRDFVAVAGAALNAYGLVVSPKLPVKTMKDLLALAAAKPGQLSYATFGIGSTVHLVTEMVQGATGIRLNHIPYKGSGPALIDVQAGHVDMMFSTLGSILPFVKSGKLKMLAVTTPTRHKQYPDVPTVDESGVAGFAAGGWWGIHAPRGTPRSAVERINADVQRIQADSAFVSKNAEEQGYGMFMGSAVDFDRFVKAERERWAKVIADAKIKIE